MVGLGIARHHLGPRQIPCGFHIAVGGCSVSEELEGSFLAREWRGIIPRAPSVHSASWQSLCWSMSTWLTRSRSGEKRVYSSYTYPAFLQYRVWEVACGTRKFESECRGVDSYTYGEVFVMLHINTSVSCRRHGFRVRLSIGCVILESEEARGHCADCRDCGGRVVS
jgi:hypothetical protein